MHIWHLWKLSNFHNGLPPCPSTSKILPPFWPWTSNFKRISPSPSDKQSIKGKRNPRLTNYYMLSGSFLQVSLGFQYQLISLVWLSFEFLHLRYLLFCGFIILCVQLFYITKCLLFIIIHIFVTHFAINSFLFAELENVNKLWNNNRTVHENERNQNKNKTKPSHIQIDQSFYCSIWPTNSSMVLLKDGSPFDVRVKKKIPCQ